MSYNKLGVIRCETTDVARQDPVLALPEGYYLACRCSVPWTNLSVGRVAHLVLEEILLRSTLRSVL